MLGDTGVGKATLRKAYCKEIFIKDYKETVGADIGSKHIVVDDNNYVLQIWELGGQDRFKQINTTFYKGAIGAILVFDITQRNTFDNLTEWLADIKNENSNIEIVLIGNKIDLRAINQDCVSLEEGQELANKLSVELSKHVPYFEASAINNSGVEEAFESIGYKVIDVFESG